jgi:hypothetical protein
VALWESHDTRALGDDWEIRFSYSTDDGITWADPAPLNTNAAFDEGDDLHPSIAVDNHGTWIAVWDSTDDLGGTVEGSQNIFMTSFALDAKDCNDNSISDACDIASGTSEDRNIDGIPDECEIFATLDVKPGSCPNSVNRQNHGLVPVALIGDDSLDVTQVDLDTVRLLRGDGVLGSVTPRWGRHGPRLILEDVGSPVDGALCGCQETRRDGIDDLILRFSTEELTNELRFRSVQRDTVVPVLLRGSLFDGTPFEASDCIRILGK